MEEGEEPDPDSVEFLPLGDDDDVEKDSFWSSLVKSVENACKPWLDKLDKLAQEKKEAAEMRKELYKKEVELKEAELALKEAVEDLDEELKILQKVEENKLEQEEEEEEEEDASVSEAAKQTTDQAPTLEAEEDDEEEDDDDDEDTTASSFGSIEGENSKNSDQKESSGKTKFASASLSFGNFNLITLVNISLMLQLYKLIFFSITINIISFKNNTLDLHGV